MGKNNVIKSFGRILGGMVAHKILLKYTNKPESINHLQGEIDNYRDHALEIAISYHWSENDILHIKEEIKKSFKAELKEDHFKDVKFSMDDAMKIMDETLKEVLE